MSFGIRDRSTLCCGCGQDFILQHNESARLEYPKLAELGCPFVCPVCNQKTFGWRAHRDISFVWPIPLPDTYGEAGLIVKPDGVNDERDELYGRSDRGILLSMGPGWWGKPALPGGTKPPPGGDRRQIVWNRTEELPFGTMVLFDKTVPWFFEPKGYNGLCQYVVICGARDIKGVVIDD